MNPFKYGQVVSADDFCSRPRLIRELTGFIRSGQKTVLQGERRMGKTSLIYEAVRQVRACRLLYVDLLEIKTNDDLCKRMVKALISMEQQAGFLEKAMKALAHLRPVLSLDAMTGEPSVSLDAAVEMQAESAEAVLDLIKAANQRKPLAVVFDEFQDILNLPDSSKTLAILRGKIQFHANIPYIFAGSVRNRMDDIFTSPDSAFFKSAASLDVGPLEKEAFESFISKKFAMGKRMVDPKTMTRIFEIAGNVPGDVQELCGALWEVTNYKDFISNSSLPVALGLIFARESKGYETAMTQMTAHQLKCLMGLARMGGAAPMSGAFVKGAGLSTPAVAQKAIARLVKLKIIYRYEGEYKFLNPFFKSWLLWKNY